ncbi:MAG: hypothetical protein ACK5Z2_08480 [Bacteroidota bacterium]|jgi:hypothetical protein
MSKYIPILFVAVLTFSAAKLDAQEQQGIAIDSLVQPVIKPVKWKPKLMPGAAFSYSVINNRKEIRGLYKPGMNFSLFYLHRPWFGISAEYTYHFIHPAAPAIDGIRSWNADLNGNLIMKLGESDLFFNAIFGVGYLKWDGVYIGPNSAHTDFRDFTYGMIISQTWVSANLGAGFSHSIGKRFVGYGNFKVRFASEEVDLFSISDTGFQFGVRADISAKPKNVRDKTNEPRKRSISLNERTPNSNVKKKGGKSKSKYVYRWLKKKRR